MKLSASVLALATALSAAALASPAHAADTQWWILVDGNKPIDFNLDWWERPLNEVCVDARSGNYPQYDGKHSPAELAGSVQNTEDKGEEVIVHWVWGPTNDSYRSFYRTKEACQMGLEKEKQRWMATKNEYEQKARNLDPYR